MALGEKTGGRTKGTANKITAEARAKMSEILQLSLDKLKNRIDQLDDKDLIQLATLCSRHTVPVPKEINEDGTTDTHIIIKGNLIK